MSPKPIHWPIFRTIPLSSEVEREGIFFHARLCMFGGESTCGCINKQFEYKLPPPKHPHRPTRPHPHMRTRPNTRAHIKNRKKEKKAHTRNPHPPRMDQRIFIDPLCARAHTLMHVHTHARIRLCHILDVGETISHLNNFPTILFGKIVVRSPVWLSCVKKSLKFVSVSKSSSILVFVHMSPCVRWLYAHRSTWFVKSPKYPYCQICPLSPVHYFNKKRERRESVTPCPTGTKTLLRCTYAGRKYPHICTLSISTVQESEYGSTW